MITDTSFLGLWMREFNHPGIPADASQTGIGSYGCADYSQHVSAQRHRLASFVRSLVGVQGLP
jgi:hypothetical protein